MSEVSTDHHDAKSAGHWGSKKTLDIIQRKFKFPNMADIVKRHVQSCDVCQHVKAERRSTRGALQPLKIPERKWHPVHMDWILGLPPWPPQVGTYDAVITFTDRATKMVHFLPTRMDEKATNTARYFMHYIVRPHGLP